MTRFLTTLVLTVVGLVALSLWWSTRDSARPFPDLNALLPRDNPSHRLSSPPPVSWPAPPTATPAPARKNIERPTTPPPAMERTDRKKPAERMDRKRPMETGLPATPATIASIPEPVVAAARPAPPTAKPLPPIPSPIPSIPERARSIPEATRWLGAAYPAPKVIETVLPPAEDFSDHEGDAEVFADHDGETEVFADHDGETEVSADRDSEAEAAEPRTVAMAMDADSSASLIRRLLTVYRDLGNRR